MTGLPRACTYNLDPGILGRTFILNGVPTTLVGIMPPRFTKLAADLWRPVALDRVDPDISRRYFAFQARLKPGVTLQQAASDIDVIARRLAQQYPKTIQMASADISQTSLRSRTERPAARSESAATFVGRRTRWHSATGCLNCSALTART